MHLDAKTSEMQDIGKKGSENISLYSSTTFVNNPNWWNSNSTHILQSSYSKNLNMNMNFLTKEGNQVVQSRLVISDHDSSTQSSGQSHQDISEMSEDNVHEKHVSFQSGPSLGTDGHTKPVLSLGTPEVSFVPQKLDNNLSFAHVPYPYADPYYGGIFAVCGSHGMVHQQMGAISSSSRVPLPLQPAAEGPIYVNAKQYSAILRRRQLRAKQEAQNKFIKSRKPYLHESRHLHAMKRERGSGGRFLNTKQKEQQQQQKTQSSPHNLSGSMLSSETFGSSSATLMSSDSRTVSTTGSLHAQHDHMSFQSPNFHSSVGVVNMQSGGNTVGSGSNHEAPFTR